MIFDHIWLDAHMETSIWQNRETELEKQLSVVSHKPGNVTFAQSSLVERIQISYPPIIKRDEKYGLTVITKRWKFDEHLSNFWHTFHINAWILWILLGREYFLLSTTTLVCTTLVQTLLCISSVKFTVPTERKLNLKKKSFYSRQWKDVRFFSIFIQDRDSSKPLISFI